MWSLPTLYGADELVARKGTVAADRADLLTTVMHEMGHVLGYGNVAGGDSLMAATLPFGISPGSRYRSGLCPVARRLVRPTE